MTPSGPFFTVGDGLRVRVRVTPKAAYNGIGGVKETSVGAQLTLKVTAVPEDGKANKAVIKMLAKEWKMAKGDLDVVSGSTARDKVVSIAGDPSHTLGPLSAWLEKKNV